MSRAPKEASNQNKGWVSVKPRNSPNRLNRRKRRRKKNKSKNDNKAKAVTTKPKHAAPSNASTIYCQWFQEGLCHRGSNCFFIHQLDPLSERNPIEHKQMIKQLMLSPETEEAKTNVQVQLKRTNTKPVQQTTELLLPSQNIAIQPQINTALTANAAAAAASAATATNARSYNRYTDFAPSQAQQQARYTNTANVASYNNNTYEDTIHNLKAHCDPKWSEFMDDSIASWRTANATNPTYINTNTNTNTWSQQAHYNPYLTANNAHTANPYAAQPQSAYYAAQNTQTVNPYMNTHTAYVANPHYSNEVHQQTAVNTNSASKFNVDAALVNDPDAFNEEDYEVWEDENGEIIVVEKDQLYADEPYYHDKKMAKQFKKEKAQKNNIQMQQKGIRSGGQTYCYGSGAALSSNNKRKTKAYSCVAAKFNDMSLNVGKVETVNKHSNPDHNPNAKICRFWLYSQCNYGEDCNMGHRFASSKCPHCDKVVGTSPAIQQHHLARCQSKIALDAEGKISATVECGICKEQPLRKGKKFGLLTGCSHCFCLNCIREWRGVVHQSKESTRACPICRQITYFIVPCDRFVTDPKRKKIIVQRYKERLAEIRCKHFEGNEECPFGSSCFYKHVRKDGSIDDKKLNLRHMINADGETEIMKQMRLSEFLFGDLSD